MFGVTDYVQLWVQSVQAGSAYWPASRRVRCPSGAGGAGDIGLRDGPRRLRCSHLTVSKVLRRHDLPPALRRGHLSL